MEMSFKISRDRFYDYHANSKEEYARLKKKYKETYIISDKIDAFEIKMAENDPPRHFIFDVDMDYPSALHDRDFDYPMAR